MLLFLAFGSTKKHFIGQLYIDCTLQYSEALFMFFCDIYNISLGMIGFSTPFVSSVMCVDTQHISVHPNVWHLLMNVEDTYKAALAPHQKVNIGNKNYTINPNTQILAFHSYSLLSIHSCLHYINLTYNNQSIDKRTHFV
jgi:hypothetical protein